MKEQYFNFVLQERGAGKKYAQAKRAKQKYNLKCTKKYVTFYIKDAKLLEIANSINFQKFVKYHLQQILDRNKGSK